MATNKVQEGNVITWANATGSDVDSGDAIIIGNLMGIALVDIANGASGEVAIDGVYQMTKLTGAGTAFTAGQKAYFSANGNPLTALSASGYRLGYAVAAATSAATTVDVLLDGSVAGALVG